MKSAPPTAAPSPNALPIWSHADAIVEAVRNHRVVVVEGPAGCGKTTQLPRMLKAAGLIPRRMGITQPRRIAAIGVAQRIAFEEETMLGEEVGYSIRFDDRTSGQTRIKVMTDGILLQEVRSDPMLSRYDIIMVDEAHERTLNIDFTLGLLLEILRHRSDLKIVISSATLHAGHFQNFFCQVVGPVPVLVVPTRMFDLSFQYAPPQGGGSPAALVDAAIEAVCTLTRDLHEGHILVFLPGEGIINRVAQGLVAQNIARSVILPLYGRLPQKEQERVFADTAPNRKIILSTNIAETSITIDGTAAVVDCGLHKLPWHDGRTGVTTLREEPISRASATQRAGRAGRTGPGTVVRLYREDAMQKRPEFGSEEILRIDLSEAVLRLIDLNIKDVERFDFPTAPPKGKLLGALRHLMALGAIDSERNLTPVGRRMVPFPLMPSLARMVVEANDRYPLALNDVLLTGAFLSVRSPFNYPQGKEEAAQAAHAKFRHKLGDALTNLTAYNRWQRAEDKEGFCQKSFLEHDTMKFVARAHDQLKDIAQEHGAEVRDVRADPVELLQCLVRGFADKVLMRRGPVYETLTGLTVAIHPSSALYGSSAPFVVAAELMSSGRTYAFNVAAVEPAWVAEASSEAARIFRLNGPGAKGAQTPRARPAKETLPESIKVGQVRLDIDNKGKPTVVIGLSQVEALMHAPLETLPQQYTRMRAKVTTPYGALLRGKLFDVLESLGKVPWPANTSQDARAPLGVLMELDRTLHPLARFAEHLMTAQLGPQVPLTGWLALVSNRSGGVWFDVIADYVEALVFTLEALDDVRDSTGFDPGSPVGQAVIKASDKAEALIDNNLMVRGQAPKRHHRGRGA